jgi:hypothetical protein
VSTQRGRVAAGSTQIVAELGLGHAVVPALPDWDRTARPGLRLIPIPMLPPLSAGWAVRQWNALSSLARAYRLHSLPLTAM